MEKNKHIQMQHFISIKRAYFDNEFLPALKKVQEKIIPPQKTYLIAGKNICLKFYSPALSEFMTHALAHHRESGTKNSDLTVHLFDSKSTSMPLPAPWSKSEYYFKQETDAKYESDTSFLGVYWYDETLNLYNPETREAYFWTYDATKLPNWVGAAPLRSILQWFLLDHRIHLIHGAIFGENGKAVLLSAKSGSGKSTTALACLFDGMDYLADDYGAIQSASKVTAHNLYSSIKILKDGFDIFPELKDKVWNQKHFDAGTDNKGMVFLKDSMLSQMKPSAELSAIFIPKITGGTTRIVPASKLAGMLALIPSTLFQLPLVSAKKIEELKNIISRVPCYYLELGPEIRKIPEVIKDFLKTQN